MSLFEALAAIPATTWLLIAAAMTAISACVSAIAVWRTFLRLRLIQDVATSTVRAAHQGIVELKGVAENFAADPNRSPGGRRCVWWRSRRLDTDTTPREAALTACGEGLHSVFDYEGLGVEELGSVWQDRRSDSLFLLRDGDEVCIVDPEGAEVYPSLRQDRIADGGSRLREDYVLEGDSLYVIGRFESHYAMAPEHDQEAEVATLLRHWKRTRYNELVAEFDMNGDLALDTAEWASVRQNARQIVERKRQGRARQMEVSVIAKPASGLFIIAAMTEPALRKYLLRRMLWAMVGFLLPLLLLAGCAYRLLGD